MDKLDEMAARVLRTGQAEKLAGKAAAEVFEGYAERVSEAADALRRDRAAALHQAQSVICR
jgi:hypothetical protein